MVEWLCKPNVYYIKPVNGSSQEWIVNSWQLQDLQKAHNISETSSE